MLLAVRASQPAHQPSGESSPSPPPRILLLGLAVPVRPLLLLRRRRPPDHHQGRESGDLFGRVELGLLQQGPGLCFGFLYSIL